MSDRSRRLTQLLGAEATARLKEKTAVIVGCGALGSASASYLVRAGVGRVIVVDFDVVHATNLGDQCLYAEEHAAALVPKVDAAAQQLARFNSDVQIDAVAAMFDKDNALDLVHGADVILDAVDNLETKYLLNDVSVATGVPLIYGGCVGTHGSILVVIPGRTPCLRCVWPAPPAGANAATCSSIGLLPTTPGFVSALQATEALKILAGRADEVCRGPLLLDLWQAGIRDLANRSSERSAADCPACVRRELVYLQGTEEVTETPVHAGLGLGLCM